MIGASAAAGIHPRNQPGDPDVLRLCYDSLVRRARSPGALWLLAAVSFAESSVFPIPPDALMIPMILAAPRRAFRIALVATVSSVIGGLLGYAIGAFLYDAVGRPVLELHGSAEAVAEFNQTFNDWGAWAVLVAGVTPFPYKVITIVSGWTGLSIPVFVAASTVARGLRFFIVAALLWRFGEPIRTMVEKRLGLWFTVFCVLLVGGFALLGLA